jgi:hypothetical protein
MSFAISSPSIQWFLSVSFGNLSWLRSSAFEKDRSSPRSWAGSASEKAEGSLHVDLRSEIAWKCIKFLIHSISSPRLHCVTTQTRTHTVLERVIQPLRICWALRFDICAEVQEGSDNSTSAFLRRVIPLWLPINRVQADVRLVDHNSFPITRHKGSASAFTLPNLVARRNKVRCFAKLLSRNAWEVE